MFALCKTSSGYVMETFATREEAETRRDIYNMITPGGYYVLEYELFSALPPSALPGGYRDKFYNEELLDSLSSCLTDLRKVVNNLYSGMYRDSKACALDTEEIIYRLKCALNYYTKG